MVDQYIGEIKLVGFNFAPYQWARCTGQIVPISQNPALFALLGTMYGGNGTSNYGLPDLQGRAAGCVGPNLYTNQGMKLGSETVTINASEYPAHSHAVSVSSNTANSPLPTGRYLSTTGPAANPPLIYTPAQGATLQPIFNGSTNPVIGFAAGGSQPHENRMPYLAMTYCIALQGVYPPRS